MYILKKGYKNLFWGALYLTNNKFCTMGRSWREVLYTFYQAQESLYSIGLRKKKRVIQVSGDKI